MRPAARPATPIRQGNREVAKIKVKSCPRESKIEQNRMSGPNDWKKMMALILSNQTHQGGEQMAAGYFDDAECRREPLENLPMARPKPKIPVFQAEAVQQVTEQMPMPL
jgi:hypothetical protein